MHKSPCQLNQPLVKIPIRTLLIRQPQILQDIMRLIKQLPVETVEKPQIMGIVIASLEGLDHGGNTGALMAHPASLPPRPRWPKRKVKMLGNVPWGQTDMEWAGSRQRIEVGSQFWIRPLRQERNRGSAQLPDAGLYVQGQNSRIARPMENCNF